MPVKRFRSLAEAEASVWIDADDPRLGPTIAAVWTLADRMCPQHFPPGVYKHRSIEDAYRQRERWEAENVRRATEKHERQR